MLEKGKISAFQMAFMILPTITATAVLIVPSISSKYAERDMWISPIFASLNGFLLCLSYINYISATQRSQSYSIANISLVRFQQKLLDLSIYFQFYIYVV
ncbi:hypothetical protein OMD49_27905 [Bacillus anthracis]|nr:hypothetical protein [Bacillus anthracis]